MLSFSAHPSFSSQILTHFSDTRLKTSISRKLIQSLARRTVTLSQSDLLPTSSQDFLNNEEIDCSCCCLLSHSSVGSKLHHHHPHRIGHVHNDNCAAGLADHLDDSGAYSHGLSRYRNHHRLGIGHNYGAGYRPDGRCQVDDGAKPLGHGVDGPVCHPGTDCSIKRAWKEVKTTVAKFRLSRCHLSRRLPLDTLWRSTRKDEQDAQKQSRMMKRRLSKGMTRHVAKDFVAQMTTVCARRDVTNKTAISALETTKNKLQQYVSQRCAQTFFHLIALDLASSTAARAGAEAR